MNVYAVIIGAALLFDYGITLLAEWLNLKTLNNEVPDEFADLYSPERYAKAQAYARARTRYGWVTETVGLAALLLFWFAGGFEVVDRCVRALGAGPVVSGLLYIGALVLARQLLMLPFDVYDTFVIENRFGFNRTTRGTFVADRLKILLLAVLIGGPLLAAVLALFEYADASAWWWCWLVMITVMVLLQYVGPTWIMPLFNTFTPLADGELRTRLLAYAESVDFPLENVYVIDGSRRSTRANAFFTGFGRRKRVALFDTLVDKHSIDELVGILAHEIGHCKRRHLLKGLLLGMAHAGILFFLLSRFISSRELASAFAVSHVSIYAGLVFFMLLYHPIEMVLGVLVQALSRRYEFDADRFAARTVDDVGHFAQALKKLSVDHLANLTPHPLLVFLTYSHPPVLQRIRALTRMSSGVRSV